MLFLYTKNKIKKKKQKPSQVNPLFSTPAPSFLNKYLQKDSYIECILYVVCPMHNYTLNKQDHDLSHEIN